MLKNSIYYTVTQSPFYYYSLSKFKFPEKSLTVPDFPRLVSFGLVVQCFTSPPTQYRLYGRRFLQVKRPNHQYQSTEGDATKEKQRTKTTKSHI